MADVVEIDFGKDLREAQRKFSRLSDAVEKFNREFNENPRKFYDRAVDEIVRLQAIIRNAEEALRIPVNLTWDSDPAALAPAGVYVPVEDYHRWKRAEAVICDATYPKAQADV